MMLPSFAKAEAFHELHRRGRPLLLVNGWDVASIQAIAAAGLPAVATSSHAMAASQGYPDGEAIPRDLLVGIVRRIAAAVPIPVSVDIEAGYGGTPEAASQTITALLRAGVAGINIEDGLVGGIRMLRDANAQAETLSAIRETAWQLSVPLFINARIDTFLLGDGPQCAHIDETVRRAQLYLDAGADGIFVPGAEHPATIETLVAMIDAPLNVMATRRSPSLRQLAELGVARISLGAWPHLAQLGMLREMAAAISDGFDLAPLEG